jgi:hypothetical protein
LGVHLTLDAGRVAFVDETRATRDPASHILSIERVHVLELRTGKAIATIDVEPNVIGLTLDRKRLLVRAIPNRVQGESLAAYDIASGKEVWRYMFRSDGFPAFFGKENTTDPIVVGDNVWFWNGQSLLGFDTQTGKETRRVGLVKEARVVRAWPTSDGLVVAGHLLSGYAVPVQTLFVDSNGRVSELVLGSKDVILGVYGNTLVVSPPPSSRFLKLRALAF